MDMRDTMKDFRSNQVKKVKIVSITLSRLGVAMWPPSPSQSEVTDFFEFVTHIKCEL
jgi:hypothetical protein